MGNHSVSLGGGADTPVRVERLSCGIRWAMQSMPACTPTVTIMVLVNVGSRNETPGQSWGLSHLFEHLLFKGTAKYPNAVDLSRTVNKIGGNFNAFTDNERTAYYITVGKKYAQRAIRVLSQMICHPLVLIDDFVKEKGAVIEELRREEDNPTSDIWNVTMEHLYQGQFGKNIGATVESVQHLDPRVMLNFFHTHYTPENMVIGVAGDVAFDDVQQWLDHYFQWPVDKSLDVSTADDGYSASRLRKARTQRQVHNPQLLPRTGDAFGGVLPPNVAHKKKDTAQHHVCVSWPVHDFDRLLSLKRTAVLSVLSALLGGYMSSRLWVFVREQAGGRDSTEDAWAYTVRMGVDTYADTAFLSLYMGLRSNAVNKAMTETLAYIKSMRHTGEHPITLEEVDDAKTHLLETFKNGSCSSSSRAQSLASTLGYWLRKQFKKQDGSAVTRIPTVEDKIKYIGQVTLHEVQEELERVMLGTATSPIVPHIAYIGPTVSTAQDWR
jgi:predicted Zn-dependent peptidase